jgi:hypothetical protein
MCVIEHIYINEFALFNNAHQDKTLEIKYKNHEPKKFLVAKGRE